MALTIYLFVPQWSVIHPRNLQALTLVIVKCTINPVYTNLYKTHEIDVYKHLYIKQNWPLSI